MVRRVLAVQHAAYAVEAELIGFPALPPAHETADGLRACGEELWLCEEDGAIVGVVGLEGGEDEVLIARLFVAPAAFRRGVGRALVGHALSRAGGRRVRVGTSARNAPALALYERFGFVPVREREPAPGVAYVELVREPA